MFSRYEPAWDSHSYTLSVVMAVLGSYHNLGSPHYLACRMCHVDGVNVSYCESVQFK